MPGTPLPVAPRFAKNMKWARVAVGLTQAQLAARMRDRGFGWTASTVAVSEACKRSLRLEECAGVAAILGVPLDRMITEPANRVAQIAKDNMRREVA